MEEPAAYGKLGLANLLELREECLREFQFVDAYRSIKQRFANYLGNNCLTVSSIMYQERSQEIWKTISFDFAIIISVLEVGYLCSSMICMKNSRR